ncbi:MAG: hypothetical protein DHS20C19_24940 [Acidimicrobiales bacterium]|nr:MAG: hypothetical protein DHS20C19_24940 [Acidimicrobiales bacterium]
MSDGTVAVGRSRPRVGLVGNPSDLYAGAVLAFSFDAFETAVTIEPDDAWVLPHDGHDLVAATIARFAAHTRKAIETGRVTVETTVPRQSGLAGSSAIVIACLRALAVRAGTVLSPFELAAMALAVEAHDLGIVAGAQDRVAQAYDDLVLVDLAVGLREASVSTIDRSLLPRLVIAWSLEPGLASGDVHGPVRARWEDGDAAVITAAAEWRALALRAATAVERGDRAALGEAIDRTFDLRAGIFPIAAADDTMVALARAHGAAANQCGSGGSVVALPSEERSADELRSRFEAGGFGALAL